MFNFFRYKKESQFYDGENKKGIGKVKDGLNGEIIEEFVALGVKMYLVRTKKKEMRKAKEVKKNILKKDYVHCLF